MNMDCSRIGLLVAALGGMLWGCAARNDHSDGKGPATAKPASTVAAGKPKIEIDFTKRYDIYFKAGDDGVNSLVELKGCRFIGYVGQGGIEAPERYVYPTPSFSKGERYVPDLTHLWVNDMVLERADGRRVYIPGGSIAYFMESAP